MKQGDTTIPSEVAGSNDLELDLEVEAIALTADENEHVGVVGLAPDEREGRGTGRVAGSSVDIADVLTVNNAEMNSVPAGLRSEDAALGHLLATSLHAVRTRGPRPAESVAVIGGTPHGLSTVLVLLASGIGKVALIDEHAECRAVAQALGGVGLLPPQSEDDLAFLHTQLDDYGPDVVFECNGSPATTRLAIELVRPAGRVVLARADEAPVELNPNVLVMTDKRVQACWGYGGDDVRVVLDLVADGRLRADALRADVSPTLDELSSGERRAESNSCRSIVATSVKDRDR